MDDLYLSYQEQCRLTQNSVADGNKLLQGRGLPGTHDIELCLGIFRSLITRYKGEQVISEENPVRIPSYDKSAYGGLGDRSANDTVVTTPADVILFEGWFNGFRALDADRIRLAYLLSDIGNVVQQHPMYHIEQINTALAAYEPIWWLFDEFIYLQTDDINNVYQWRLEQEHDLIAKYGTGMTDDQVVHFIDRYMACYKLYYQKMCDEGIPKITNLRICITTDREVTSTEVFTGE
jgi:D-glycerate 3-kinase